MLTKSTLAACLFRVALLALLAGAGMFVMLLGAAAPVTIQAQDDPPSPTPTPPDFTASIPFSDTFTTGWGWQASGAWTFDPDGGVDSGGWRLDATRRGMVSVLAYGSPIDLSGSLPAQLLFRQDGYLPESDLIAVDLSLDGGKSWRMVDMQSGTNVAWALRSVDLEDYRGQIVRLRIRVVTGTQPLAGNPQNGEYRIDNLAIQFTAPEAPRVIEPEDWGPRTLMGFHLAMGAPNEPVVAFARRMRALGWPLGTLKGTTGTESTLNRVAQVSPETVIVYRALETPWGMIDCPNVANDPVREAQIWVSGLQSHWRAVQADYYELMNECLPPVDWLVSFSIEAMRQAQARGQCLLLFSFSAGHPEPEYFARLQPVFEHALENPCQPGRYHGIAFHAYGINKATLVSEADDSVSLRHRRLYAALLQDLPEAVLLPVFITEAGAGDGRTRFECEDIARDVVQYTSQLERDRYVRGFHLWNLGSQGEWFDATQCMPLIEEYLARYYAQR